MIVHKFGWFQELFGQAISIIVNPLTCCWLTPQCSVGRWKLHCLLRIKIGNKGSTMDDFPSLGISASLDRGSVIAVSGNGLCCCGSQNNHQWSSPILAHHGAGIVSNICPCPTSTKRKKSHEVDRLNHQHPSTINPRRKSKRYPSKSQKNWLVLEPYPSEKWWTSSVGVSLPNIYIYIHI